nr:MAG TPA: hypothetical protein [Caudoviricetes sp.]
MWVRSQDKQLLTNASAFSMDASIENRVWIYNQNGYCLGTYTTKKRAIEVLNIIQNAIAFYEVDRDLGISASGVKDSLNTFYPIFEMPEK